MPKMSHKCHHLQGSGRSPSSEAGWVQGDERAGSLVEETTVEKSKLEGRCVPPPPARSLLLHSSGCVHLQRQVSDGGGDAELVVVPDCLAIQEAKNLFIFLSF